MSSLGRVSGVLGLCRVVSGNPTQAEAAPFVGLRGGVSGVLGLASRARGCGQFFSLGLRGALFSYARAEKLNKPNTPDTDISNALICKGFSCVGFVLGCLFLCWVRVLGVVGHD